MNILVCVKQVPDTETRFKLDGTEIVTEGIQYVVNPYDEYALEEAIQLQEARGGTVTVISLGPERAREAIMTALALGADEAIHLSAPEFQGGDAIATARALAAAIQKLEYDIIFCGRQSVDEDNGQVGILVAEMLGLPHVAIITKLEVAEDGTSARAEREVEGGKAVIDTPLPAVFTAQKGLNEPRYPSFRGIRMARKKPQQLWGLDEVDLEADQVGESGALSEVEGLAFPPERAAGRIVEGEVPEAAAELVRLLREEAKVV
jgi:electron transfer flavoprotein beta subunit